MEQEESNDNVISDSFLPRPINSEIIREAHQYKKAVQQGVPAPDEIDESI